MEGVSNTLRVGASRDSCRRLAMRLHCPYVETSAETGDGLLDVLSELVRVAEKPPEEVDYNFYINPYREFSDLSIDCEDFDNVVTVKFVSGYVCCRFAL